MQEDVTKALEILNARMRAAEDKRAELEIQMREADTEIANISKAIRSVLTVLGVNKDEPISELGITDAVRRVVSSQVRMTANEIRGELEKQGFNLSGYQNPMASIYKILTRLHGNDELEVEKEDWKVFYKAKPRFRVRQRKSRMARAFAQARQTKLQEPTPTHPTLGTWIAFHEPKKDETK
jgi:hypothetical protein